MLTLVVGNCAYLHMGSTSQVNSARKQPEKFLWILLFIRSGGRVSL